MTDTFATVWDAIANTPEETAAMKMQADIMIAITNRVRAWDIIFCRFNRLCRRAPVSVRLAAAPLGAHHVCHFLPTLVFLSFPLFWCPSPGAKAVPARAQYLRRNYGKHVDEVADQISYQTVIGGVSSVRVIERSRVSLSSMSGWRTVRTTI